MSRSHVSICTALVLAFFTLCLCVTSVASAASFSRAQRYHVIKHARTYDVVRRNHTTLIVRDHRRYVKVDGVVRYKVVRRAYRFVSLRRLQPDGARSLAGTVALSIGLPSWASSAASGRGPDAANDNDVLTRWTAASGAYPQSWTVDLGSPVAIAAISVDWYHGARRAYRYRIQTSDDGVAFGTVVDGSRNAMPGASLNPLATTARYVRVEVVGVSPKGAWASAREITVLGPVEEPSPEPTPTPTPPPAPSSYTLTPSGGNDTAAIQGAVDACGTKGGTVSFAPGTYTITAPIKLPPGNSAPLVLSGYGAKVVLSGAMGFLEFNDTADYQTFRYFTVKGFEVDATARRSVSGYYLIGATNSISSFFVRRGDVEHITLKDLSVHGAPAVPGGNAVAIGLGCKQYAENEPVTNYVRHIEIDNVRIEGGDTGILVMTDLAVAGVPAKETWPAEVSQVCDDIRIRGVYFDSGKVPPFGSVAYHTGIQINGWGKGGKVEISDCYLQGSEDNLCELDNMQVATVTNVFTKEVYGGCAFTVRRFGYPLDGAPPNEGSIQVTYTGCTYDQGTRGAEGDTGFGYAWAEINHRDHPTYTVVYNDCREIAPDGTVTVYRGPR